MHLEDDKGGRSPTHELNITVVNIDLDTGQLIEAPAILEEEVSELGPMKVTFKVLNLT